MATRSSLFRMATLKGIRWATLLTNGERWELTGATVDNLRERLAFLQQTNSDLEKKLSDLESTQFTAPNNLGFSQADVENLPGVTIDNGAMVLSEGILFNSGQASLKSKRNSTLDSIAQLLKGQYAGETFHIFGHTDNVPLRKTRDRWKTNLRLGFERAYTVFDYLTQVHGIDKKQFVVHSYGEIKPTSAGSNNTAAGRAKNRRVEIFRSGARI